MANKKSTTKKTTTKKRTTTKRSSSLKMDLSVDNLITCALFAIIGILLIILRGSSLGILMTIIGVLLIVLGVYDAVVKKDLIKGIIEAVIGLVIILMGWLIAEIVFLVFGILLIVLGAVELYKTYRRGLVAMLPAIIMLVIGVLLIVANWVLVDVFCIIAGIIFIIYAVLALFGKRISIKR